MSRIGRLPVQILDGVKIDLDGRQISVKGPLGSLDWHVHDVISVDYNADEKKIAFRPENDARATRALHGLTRSVIQNMVTGVTQGFEKRLEIVGVGYLAAVQENTLQLRVGYANEVQKVIPPGLSVTCPDQTHISVKGCDKQQVGQFAAEVRAVRKPEPYKGKGIRYENESVRRKAGKAVTK